MKIFCVKTENFLNIFVLCSISSKLLFAGFCRFLPGTRGNVAEIHSHDIPKRLHLLGNESLSFLFVSSIVASPREIPLRLVFSCYHFSLYISFVVSLYIAYTLGERLAQPTPQYRWASLDCFQISFICFAPLVHKTR